MKQEDENNFPCSLVTALEGLPNLDGEDKDEIAWSRYVHRSVSLSREEKDDFLKKKIR